MKILSFAFLLLLSIGSQAQTYVRNFEEKANSQTVGHTTATKIVMGDVTQYEIESVVTVKILFTVSVIYKAQASYKSGTLISSSASVFVNDHLQSSVVTEKEGDHYTIISDEHQTKLYEEIKFSTAKMYFNEPIDVKSVYSESEGIMKTMVKTSDGKYKVKDATTPDNSTTYGYSSEQGVHEIVVVKQHLPTLTLKHVREVPQSEMAE